MTSLNVRVNARTDKMTGKEYFEGTVQIAGLQPTKLVKNDGSTRYNARSQVTQAASRLGQKMLSAVVFEDNVEVMRQAAKKSVKKTPKKKTCTGGACCL